MRRVPSIDALIPALYLKGISTGDFSEALTAILGEGPADYPPPMWFGVTSPEIADSITVFVIPFRPARWKLAHLISARSAIPGLRNQLHSV